MTALDHVVLDLVIYAPIALGVLIVILWMGRT
jgi:hypothetical protein